MARGLDVSGARMMLDDVLSRQDTDVAARVPVKAKGGGGHGSSCGFTAVVENLGTKVGCQIRTGRGKLWSWRGSPGVWLGEDMDRSSMRWRSATGSSASRRNLDEDAFRGGPLLSEVLGHGIGLGGEATGDVARWRGLASGSGSWSPRVAGS